MPTKGHNIDQTLIDDLYKYLGYSRKQEPVCCATRRTITIWEESKLGS